MEKPIEGIPFSFQPESLKQRYGLSDRELDTLLNLRGDGDLSRMSLYGVLEFLDKISPEARCQGLAVQLGWDEGFPQKEKMPRFFAAAISLLRSGKKEAPSCTPEELLTDDLAALAEKGGVSRETVEKLAWWGSPPKEERFFRLLVTAAVLRNSLGDFTGN